MDELTIQVRSPFQKALLEVLWNLDTVEQCWAFRDSLPNPQQRDICTAMIMLLSIEYLDKQINTEADCEQARDIISSY